jgi:hypothetical protein
MTPALTPNQTSSLASEIFTNLRNASARHSWDIFIEMHGGPKSAVSQVDASATSYVHRDKMLLFQLSDVGEDGKLPQEAFANLRRFMDSVTSSMQEKDWGMYANFLDTQLGRGVAQKTYWGENLPKLAKMKGELDPKDFFWNPQGIAPKI